MFLRHLSYVLPIRQSVPRVVAELGPGSSLAMGLAALIAGADTYHALDIADHTDVQRDLEIFDRLIQLFGQRSPISDEGVNRDTFPLPLGWEFPDEIAQRLDVLLEPERLAAIRRAVERRDGRIHLHIPWSANDGAAARNVDWIISHAVLMYVDDVEATLRALESWLVPGGLMTYQIDYTSSNLTRRRNGHWALGDLTMRLMRGKRPHLLNRLPHSAYLRLFADLGYEIVAETRDIRPPDPPRRSLHPRYRELSDEDLETAEGFMVCVRR